ncbi:hypothetical protein [Brevibacterium zhoupengii]|uniref:magnesium chelatase subunit ChlI family protein n=1 Tax=Brevibacterium zhoupengii TaxID=2898795 RepID=UPI001F092175
MSPADIRLGGAQEESAAVAGRVRLARQRQTDRYVDCEWTLNANASGAWLREHFSLIPNSLRDLDRALDTGRVTMRGYDRVLRVATTLADLEGAAAPTSDRITTALALRTHDS